MILSLFVRKTSEWVGRAALPCRKPVERFDDRHTLNGMARTAMLDRRIGRGINAAETQLTCCDTDRAGLILKCPGVVLIGVRQRTALRANQQHRQ